MGVGKLLALLGISWPLYAVVIDVMIWVINFMSAFGICLTRSILPQPLPLTVTRNSIEKGFRLQFDQQILLENIITLVYRERESRLSQRVCIGVAEQYDRKFIFTYIYLHITYNKNNKNVALPLTFRLANY